MFELTNCTPSAATSVRLFLCMNAKKQTDQIARKSFISKGFPTACAARKAQKKDGAYPIPSIF